MCSFPEKSNQQVDFSSDGAKGFKAEHFLGKKASFSLFRT